MSEPPSISSVIRGFIIMKYETHRAVKLVFTYTPGWTAVSILLIVLLGILPQFPL